MSVPQENLIKASRALLDAIANSVPGPYYSREIIVAMEDVMEALRQVEWTPQVGDYVIADCDITHAMLTYVEGDDRVYIKADSMGRISKLVMWNDELSSFEVAWEGYPPVYHDFRILRDWLRLR